MRLIFTGVLCLLTLNAQANVIQYFAGISYNNPADLFKVKNGILLVGGTGSYADLQFKGSALNFNTIQGLITRVLILYGHMVELPSASMTRL